MTNPESSADLEQTLQQYAGRRIEGGCSNCDAYQTVERIHAGVWRLNVHHDDGCPTLAEYEQRARP